MASRYLLFCFLSLFLCFAVFANSEARVQKFWCVLKRGVPDAAVQQFLDSVCKYSQTNCSAINPGGACYIPNTYANHGSYALDLFFNVRGVCRTDIGRFTDNDPSYGNCQFP